MFTMIEMLYFFAGNYWRFGVMSPVMHSELLVLLRTNGILTAMAEVLLLAAIGLLVFCLLLTLLALLIFSGLFENVNVGTGKPPIGEVTLAYKFARGPYKDSGQLFTEISLLAPPGGHRCIGIYYDDPKSVICLCVLGHWWQSHNGLQL